MTVEPYAQLPQTPDLRRFSGTRDCGIDGRRMPVFDELGNDPGARWPDGGNVTQRVRSDQVADGFGNTGDGSGRTLVAQSAALGALQRSHVVEERRGVEVGIRDRRQRPPAGIAVASSMSVHRQAGLQNRVTRINNSSRSTGFER